MHNAFLCLSLRFHHADCVGFFCLSLRLHCVDGTLVFAFHAVAVRSQCGAVADSIGRRSTSQTASHRAADAADMREEEAGAIASVGPWARMVRP